MDFFDSIDWLNRPGPYAFLWDHWMLIILPLALGLFLALFLRGKDKKLIRNWLISLWIFAVVISTFYYAVRYIECIVDPVKYVFELDEFLPFHSCSMFLYVFPVAMFAKNKIIKTMASNFLVIINMIIGFITLFVGCPTGGCSSLSFGGLHGLISHNLIVIVPFIMVFTGYYDIKKEDLKWGLAGFGILSITMYIFDAITGCDYFFFYDGHTFPVFSFISENVPHIVWTLIVLTCYTLTGVIIHFLIIGIKSLVQKRQKEKQA